MKITARKLPSYLLRNKSQIRSAYAERITQMAIVLGDENHSAFFYFFGLSILFSMNQGDSISPYP